MKFRRNRHYRDWIISISRNTCRFAPWLSENRSSEHFWANLKSGAKINCAGSKGRKILPDLAYGFICVIALFCPCGRKQRFPFAEKTGGVATEMEKDYTRELCIALLRQKSEELNRLEEARFPKRSDFSEEEVVAIKAYLGPWPRALEAAGLKEARSTDRLEKNREKRIRAKRTRRENEKLKKQEQNKR